MSNVWKEDELTCKPLDTMSEISMFLQNPPPWRSLCKELLPHSKQIIKNADIKKDLRKEVSRVFLDGPETFCHFDPDAEEVKRKDENSLPKTLVCHDMANGYHDDSNIDGTGNSDAYTFYNWAGIDIFCYFSHHLITIPPLGWINVGHAHGVKVIGTVITEWAEGVEFWDKVLASESEYKDFASALVAIAKTLKFDGWLLNIENKIAKPDVLLEFVQHLHHILHQELNDPVLIWYDSVTVEGHLNWQNALNHKNKAFFDLCDGFFTNYSWTEADVSSSAKVAGDRIKDVFIGIDVWGRNFHGGGQFNIQQAIDVAYKNGCSLAIFAPAWTHEAMPTDKSDANTVAMCDNLSTYEHFLLRDRALWDSIWEYLNTKLPCALPFKTSFCRGQGKKRRLYGEVLCPVPWYNLRHMQYQPNSSHGPHGYLLSTMDHIMHASRHGILRNSKGIIKYRELPKENLVESQAIESTEDNEDAAGIIPKSDSISALSQENDDTEMINDNEIDENSGKRSKSIKRKIKSAFKHIFRVKTPKTHDGNDIEGTEQVPEQAEDEQTVSPAHEQHDDNKLESNNSVKIHEKRELVLNVQPELVSNDGKDKDRNDSEQQTQEKDTVDKLNEEIDEPPMLKDRSMVQMSINIKLKDATAKTRYGLACVPDELQCLEVYFEDSFIGGSCLKVNPSDPVSPEHRMIRLFHCDFFCEHPLIVCIVTKNVRGNEEQFLNVRFHLKDANDEDRRVVLIGRSLPHERPTEDNSSCLVNVHPIDTNSDTEFRKIQKYLLLNYPDLYIPVENSYNWVVRYYEIHQMGSRVMSINCDTGLSEGPILLGHIGICPYLQES